MPNAPSLITSLPDELLERVLLKLRTPQSPQFWLLRGVSRRWLRLVRRNSNFRAEIQSHNLRTLQGFGKTAYLFHLVETTDGWRTESEFLVRGCLDDSTFFGRINECNMQILREWATELIGAVASAFVALTDRLPLQDNAPVSLEIALNHGRLNSLPPSRSPSMRCADMRDRAQRELLRGNRISNLKRLSFFAFVRHRRDYWEWEIVSQAGQFFDKLAEVGAWRSLTSLSTAIVNADEIDAKQRFPLQGCRLLSGLHEFHKPENETRFGNMTPVPLASEALKSLSISILSLGEVVALAIRFPHLEELALYGRGLKPEFDVSGLQMFASLKRLLVYLNFAPPSNANQAAAQDACCAGNKAIPAITLPSVTSLVVHAACICEHGLAHIIALVPCVRDLSVTEIESVAALDSALTRLLPTHPFLHLRRLVLNVGSTPDRRGATIDLEALLRNLASRQDRLPSLKDLEINAAAWLTAAVYPKRNLSLFCHLPAYLESVALTNVFGIVNQADDFVVDTDSGLDLLRDFINCFLFANQRLSYAAISVRVATEAAHRQIEELSSRFVDRSDQVGLAKFENGWRYLGQGRWEVKRTSLQPSVFVTLLRFDKKRQLMKFRLASKDDSLVKFLDFYMCITG